MEPVTSPSSGNKDDPSPTPSHDGSIGGRILILVEGGEVPGRTGLTAYSPHVRYWGAAVAILFERGFDVAFGTVRERGFLHDAIEELGCSTFALDCTTSKNYPGAAVDLARLLKRQKVDFIHSSEAIAGTIGGAAGVIARRGYRIYQRHHTVIDTPTKVLSRISARLAHRTIAVSHAVARRAEKDDKTPTGRITVAHNGVGGIRNVSEVEAALLRRRLAIPEDAPIVLVLGHLRAEKGQKTAFEAMPLLQRDRKSVV